MSNSIVLQTPITVQSIATGLGQLAWISPTNGAADDGQYTECVFTPLSVDQESQGLVAAYDFSQLLDSDLPFGIEVAIKRKADTAAAVDDLLVQLVHGGVPIGANKASAIHWPTSDGVLVYGAIGDDWSAGLTAAMVKSPTFGVMLQCRSLSGVGPIAFVDAMLMTVHFDAAEPEAGDGSSLGDLGLFTRQRIEWVSTQAGFRFAGPPEK